MSIFRFKQFQVDDTGAAMKVGTDAVLLGCLCSAASPLWALDIGTGSGLIALQLAQRFEQCQIHAVEIDPHATLQAAENFKKSHWSDRLQAIHADIRDWKSDFLYDLVVCNPPFYPTSHPAKGQTRQRAREQRDLRYEDLAKQMAAHLSDAGSAWCILPAAFEKTWLDALAQAKIHHFGTIRISASEGRPANRLVMAASKHTQSVWEKTLAIRSTSGNYTDDYLALTSAFYLFA